MLLDIVRGVRAAKGADWDCEIIFDHGGALREEFGSLGRVRVLSHPWTEGPGLHARLLRRVGKRVPFKARRFAGWLREWQKGGDGLIYSNTGTNGQLLAAIPRGIRVVSHIHELAYGLRRFCSARELSATLSRTDMFLAVSSATASDLSDLGVSNDRVARISNFVMTMPELADLTVARGEVCRRLGLPAVTRLICGCGHADWLKGLDLFVGIANKIVRNGENPPTFLWLGGNLHRRFARTAMGKLSDAARPFVHFIGEVDDASPYFAASEVVLVPSRIENFSRVALEAGALARPVLAFAAARGLADLLDSDCVVSEMTESAMAAALEALLTDPVDAALKGARLRDRIAKEFTAEKWIGEIIRTVEKVDCV